MPTKRPQRIERRAERVMGRAQKNYGKYEALRKSIGDREMTDNEATYADKLERRVARQETRAKNLKNKAQYITDKKMAKTSSSGRANQLTKITNRASNRASKRVNNPAKTSPEGTKRRLVNVTRRVNK